MILDSMTIKHEFTISRFDSQSQILSIFFAISFYFYFYFLKYKKKNVFLGTMRQMPKGRSCEWFIRIDH
jgi:hypothetical protein